ACARRAAQGDDPDRRRRRAGARGRDSRGRRSAAVRGRDPRPETQGVNPGRRWYDPEVQTMPRERLRALQEERLARQLARVWSVPVPFFRRKLEAAGIRSAADVRGLDDLARVPTTIKAELRRSEEEHPPFGDYRGAPPSACVRLGASTG